MRYWKLLASITIIFSLSAKPALGQTTRPKGQIEFNVEGGLDIRPQYGRNLPANQLREFPDGSEQGLSAPAVALSLMKRFEGLRSFYGLRLDAHTADLLAPDGNGRASSATVMLNYRAFLFDMQGDCDCPSWGRDNWLQRAFFVEFGIGPGYQSFSSPTEANVDRFGVSYMARLGVSHRLSKQIDVFLAAGGHGLIGKTLSIGRHDIGLRPVLGITYRPR